MNRSLSPIRATVPVKAIEEDHLPIIAHGEALHLTSRRSGAKRVARGGPDRRHKIRHRGAIASQPSFSPLSPCGHQG